MTKRNENNLITSAKRGFTLAEVLITLAIIGVVAAMTIPTLVANYQQRSWDTASSVFNR
ncbi:type II secretion system protein, partial [bacterium]|nr:type II secretion system protein [bacterium]